jgi:hypothetical protein
MARSKTSAPAVSNQTRPATVETESIEDAADTMVAEAEEAIVVMTMAVGAIDLDPHTAEIAMVTIGKDVVTTFRRVAIEIEVIAMASAIITAAIVVTTARRRSRKLMQSISLC